MLITNKCDRLPEQAQAYQSWPPIALIITKHETQNKYTVLCAENKISTVCSTLYYIHLLLAGILQARHVQSNGPYVLIFNIIQKLQHSITIAITFSGYEHILRFSFCTICNISKLPYCTCYRPPMITGNIKVRHRNLIT